MLGLNVYFLQYSRSIPSIVSPDQDSFVAVEILEIWWVFDDFRSVLELISRASKRCQNRSNPPYTGDLKDIKTILV